MKQILDTQNFCIDPGEIKRQIMQLINNENIEVIKHWQVSDRYSDIRLLGNMINALRYNTCVTKLEFCITKNQPDYIGRDLFRILVSNTTINSFIICDDSLLKDQHIPYISRMLYENTTITNLELRPNYISPEGFKDIISSLSPNTTVTHLSFQHKFDASALQTMSHLLRVNSTIKYLNLDNSIIEIAAQKKLNKLINPTLIELNLNNCNIESEGIKALTKALKNNSSLKKLILSNNEIGYSGFDMLMKSLLCNTTLENLDLHLNTVSDAGLKTLTDFLHQDNSLTILDISNIRIKNLKKQKSIIDYNKQKGIDIKYTWANRSNMYTGTGGNSL